jgi:hypothetical protein
MPTPNDDAPFDPVAFLETVASGRHLSTHAKNQIVFTQGEPAEAVFYIRSGKIKLTVVSKHGKEAIVAILGKDEFFGEGCLIGQPKRLATNKIVEVGAAKCPFCRGARISPLSRKVHEVIDLKFSKGGIRRWIVRYISRQYHCVGCGRRFRPVRFRRYRRIPKYGEGLVIWCVYQLLIGGQNIHRIHRSLKDLFGLSIPKTSVYKFKRSAACFYEKEYQKLLESLLAGSLVHIDETTINLMKDKGYVWVMTSTDSVYFFYKKSREGSFLAEMLKTFKGVLVSDFYTAYDVVNVPQQRCLIHLMRDMNDDLLKNSFDDELKSVAEKFAFLLRTIVNTIDRHGLKTKYLNKYRKDADRFCDWVVRQNFSSEVAKGYASRIIKYRHMLFTFLSYDGVPWNNNNAEHAIKSFAKYRRFADGVVTENTVKDYLVLLSVCLSCEYRGIEFLGPYSETAGTVAALSIVTLRHFA